MRKFEKISFEQFKKDVCDDRELYDKIKLPKRSTSNSAGYDITAITEGVIHPKESLVVKTGVKVAMNDDEIFYIFDRSSLGFKYNVTLVMVLPVILAARYYNKKFTIGIAVFTSLLFILSAYMSVTVGQQDLNSYSPTC